MKPWNPTLALLSLLVYLMFAPAQAASTNTLRAARFGTKALALRSAQDSETSAPTGMSPAAARTALRLATGAVDTSLRRSNAALAGDVAASAQVRSPRGRLPLLVQFDGPASAAARAALEAAGATVQGYVAPNGYLIDAPAGTTTALRLHWRTITAQPETTFAFV